MCSDNNLTVRLVETCSQVLLGKGQTNSICNTLPQRTGGDFNSGCLKVLGMSRGLASPLPEALQILFLDTVVSSEMEQSVLQHTAVASRQHEAVTVEPVRILGVIPHDLVIQNMPHRSTPHRQTRMTGVGLLDSINRQEPDRVHRLLHQRGLSSLVESLDRRSPDRAAQAAPWDPGEIDGGGGGGSGFEAREGGEGDGGGEGDAV